MENYVMHIPTGVKAQNGNEILAAIQQTKEGTWVALKPMCTALKLAWQSQLEKIKDNPRFNCNDIVIVGADGKLREMVCIPSDQVADWINSINSRKVAKEKQEALLQLQKFFQGALNAIVRGDYITMDQAEEMFDKRLKQALGPILRQLQIMEEIHEGRSRLEARQAAIGMAKSRWYGTH
jgi:hypothetical protein